MPVTLLPDSVRDSRAVIDANFAQLAPRVDPVFTGIITGNLAGNVTGNLTGNVSGSVSGTSATHTGNHTGDVTSVGMVTTVAAVGGKTAAQIAAAVNAAGVQGNLTGDVTSVGLATTVASVGGKTAAQVTAAVNASGSASVLTGNLTGDTTSVGMVTTVAAVGGKTAAAVAQSVTDTVAATNLNTASTIVKRDAAGTIAAGSATFRDTTPTTGTTKVTFQAGAGQSGNLSEWLTSASTLVAYINAAGNIYSAGNIYTASVGNAASVNNAIVSLLSTGTTITRNIADANPALIVQQINATSTGDILQLKNSAGTVVTVQKAGNVGIGVTPVISGTGKLHVAGNTARVVDTLRTPASSTDTGNTGEICIAAGFIYCCIATNTWVRAPLTTF